MKKIVTIGFALVFLLQGGVRLFIIADYNIRKEKIVAELCVNRFDPSKNCEGRCYLEKQLKKHQEQESKIPNLLKEKGELVCLAEGEAFGFGIFKSNLLHKDYYRKEPPFRTLGSIFHPPPMFLFVL